MTGPLNLKEFTRPMTSRELMLQKVVSTNSGMTDMFIMTVSIHEDQPVIQGYYEGHVHEDSPEPPSLNIGREVLKQLDLAMSDDEDEDDDTRH